MLKSSPTRTITRVFRRSFSPTILPTYRSRNLATAAAIPIQKDPAELDQIATLSNGIRVATEALPGHFSGVGVFIDAGSRYENDYLRGVSHIMDRLAFKSTKNRTSDDMLEALETLGGNINCASSRESLMYQSATFNSAVPTAVALLAETIRDPLITPEEVQQQLDTAAYEIGEIWSNPELILPELVHVAAFKDNTIGNPLLCPKERLSKIDKGVIEAYRDTFFRPDKIVLAFAGVAHEEAVRISEQYFGDMKSTKGQQMQEPDISVRSHTSLSSDNSTSVFSSGNTSPTQQRSERLTRAPLAKNLSTFVTTNETASIFSEILPSAPNMPPSALQISQPSRYTGGFLCLPNLPPPVNASLPPLTYIHLAFEGLPISSDDIYALATLQTLLGGGGSFSAGGPGKGMYSRLYTNVLNQHGWVESCVAFNHSYVDSGLFGISASCSPSYVAHMLDVICRELQALTLHSGFSALQRVEVERAKKQLKSSLLMNLESRMVELEDLGRQVQVHGRKVGVREMCQKIDRLTVSDVRRVAKMVVGGTVSNSGNGSGAPTVVLQEGKERDVDRTAFKWDEIQDRISRWKLGYGSNILR